MYLYSDGSRSWCSAAPMVRISANTSKPSNVHPRFEATSAFHCARFSERYHGESTVYFDVMGFSVCFCRGPMYLCSGSSRYQFACVCRLGRCPFGSPAASGTIHLVSGVLRELHDKAV